MTDRPIPDETMRRAEEVLDLMCCNVPEAGNVRQASILDIARALLEAREDERKLAREWCAKRQKITRDAWERDARAALAGDMRALRNRIDMIDAGPVDVVLSGEGA